MTSFVKIWVLSSAVQQTVLLSQNAGEEWQDVTSQEAAGTWTFWVHLLSLHLTHAPGAEPPLWNGESEKTDSAHALGSEGRQCDLDRKIAFTQPKSSSVTDHAATLSFFSSLDNRAWCFEANINPLFLTSLPIFLEKCSVLVLCIPKWFLFEFLFQKTHPYCSTVQPIAMKRKNNKILKDRSGILNAILGSNLNLKGFFGQSKKIFSPNLILGYWMLEISASNCVGICWISWTHYTSYTQFLFALNKFSLLFSSSLLLLLNFIKASSCQCLGIC